LDCQPLDQAACLILDVKMAGMTGLELQARFLASGGIAPIVFISSFDDSETRAKALDAGAVGFLGKPFDRQALMDLIWSQPIPTY
jgi:FixJ family two-component response regulator